jgi:hypothetical protein
MWIQNTSTAFTLIPPVLVPTPLPLVPVFPPALHFLSVYWQPKRFLPWYFRAVYIMLWSNYFLVLYHQAPLIRHSSLYSALSSSCIGGLFQFLSFSDILSPPSPAAPQTDSLTQFCSLSLFVFMCVCACVYIDDHTCIYLYI